MLKYELNFELQSKMNQGKLVVDSYQVTQSNDVEIIVKDTTNDKLIKLKFRQPRILDESFDIRNQRVSDLYIAGFKKFYRSSFFEGLMLIVDNPTNPESKFAILST